MSYTTLLYRFFLEVWPSLMTVPYIVIWFVCGLIEVRSGYSALLEDDFLQVFGLRSLEIVKCELFSVIHIDKPFPRDQCRAR